MSSLDILISLRQISLQDLKLGMSHQFLQSKTSTPLRSMIKAKARQKS